MWFSFFFADKTNRKLKFSTEEDVTFGASILDKHANSGVLAILNDETDPELNRNQWSRNAGQRFLEGPNMVVGRCIWGETDADPDTIEVYRVFDAPFYGITIPSEPVSTVKGSIPQERIEAIIIDQSRDEVPLDEIRIGPTQNSVMIGTQPL